ncbi:Flagellar basal-body rod protein FlgB [hydrothermal vent metagenome]|uniref:Flagellar basal-body rod protein FlgB n=1 Tax=hydrothermal vent metagenome TaxID=652676 RepID=A0A1W1C3L0_9ZZZZ
MLQISKSFELMKEALDYRAMRQDMIASNIANADTPFYRPKDIRFEEKLIEKKRELFAQPSHQLAMAKTSKAHLDPVKESDNAHAKIFYRDGHMARNDGNSVDLDVETSEMAKNSIMYNALINGMKKEASIFRAVIDYSGKIS